MSVSIHHRSRGQWCSPPGWRYGQCSLQRHRTSRHCRPRNPKSFAGENPPIAAAIFQNTVKSVFCLQPQLIFPWHIHPHPHKNTQPHQPFPIHPPSSKWHRAGSRSPWDPTGGCPRRPWWSSRWRSRSSPWAPWAPRWPGWWPPASTGCPPRWPGWRPRSDRCRNCSPRCWWYPPGHDRNDWKDDPLGWVKGLKSLKSLGRATRDEFNWCFWLKWLEYIVLQKLGAKGLRCFKTQMAKVIKICVGLRCQAISTGWTKGCGDDEGTKRRDKKKSDSVCACVYILLYIYIYIIYIYI